MLLHTSYVWNDGGEKIRIEAEEFVSLDQAQLAAKRFVISPEFAGTLTIRFPLRNWPPPHRYALEKMQKLQGKRRPISGPSGIRANWISSQWMSNAPRTES